LSGFPVEGLRPIRALRPDMTSFPIPGRVNEPELNELIRTRFGIDQVYKKAELCFKKFFSKIMSLFEGLFFSGILRVEAESRLSRIRQGSSSGFEDFSGKPIPPPPIPPSFLTTEDKHPWDSRVEVEGWASRGHFQKALGKKLGNGALPGTCDPFNVGAPIVPRGGKKCWVI